ncbi:Alpha beta hydrolase fold family [Coniochaeta hoffmannii]|uniref:Alpha beta hydrolase fold family n=1 Tax=Coniochaeta hoffmannii TaxID=91930 RepID=A0AA38RDL7_9PEZI|nr:Alpha beta hydrolase fold family [Coniochaeta hoffmannii]
MLDHSPFQLVQIRAAIVLLAYAPWFELGILISLIAAKAILHPYEAPGRTYLISVSTLTALLALELVFYIIKYRPHLERLRRDAQHPAPLTRRQRLALFEKCAANIPDPESYVRLWFHGAELKDIKRDNVAEFILWAFFDRDGAEGNGPIQGLAPEDHDVTAELEHYVSRTEDLLGLKLPPGRGSATCLRLTIDAIEQRYRSLLWYAIVSGVDLTTHLCLFRDGFQYYGPPLRKTLGVFPPRLQAVPALLPFPGAKRYSSASEHIGFWYRPHTARNSRPVVFIHGIGVGLWPYTRFLHEIGRPATSGRSGGGSEGQIGVIVLEILPISTRLTDPPLRREAFVEELRTILAAHAPDWLDNGFVLVSHSYGSVLTTHIIRDPDLAPHVRGIVLIDPVTLLLHLPDVAYNFTRRPPKTANEWQLWFFASMDAGVAEGLGRHFFWRENEVWKEELVGGSGSPVKAASNGRVTRSKGRDPASDRWPAVTRRKVAVSLGGRDLIVNTERVAQYLARPGDMADSGPSEHQQAVDAMFRAREAGSVATGDSPRCTRFAAPSGVEIVWFPTLDHAQVFDTREDRQQILNVIGEYCSLRSASVDLIDLNE